MALINQPGLDTVDRHDEQGKSVEVNPGWRNFFMAVYNILNALTLSGTTAQRPTKFLWVGRPYFDTTLGVTITLLSVSPIVWSVPSTVLIPGATVTGQMLRSVNGGAPVWSTDTWPNTIGAAEVLTQVGGANNIASRQSLTFNGATLQVAADNPGGDMTSYTYNTNNAAAGSRGVNHVRSDFGDALTKWELGGGQTWAAGADLSAASAWKLSASGALGTTDHVAVTPAGAITVTMPPAFVAADKYLIIDAAGNIHVSTLGPAA